MGVTALNIVLALEPIPFAFVFVWLRRRHAHWPQSKRLINFGGVAAILFWTSAVVDTIKHP